MSVCVQVYPKIVTFFIDNAECNQLGIMLSTISVSVGRRLGGMNLGGELGTNLDFPSIIEM